MKNNNTVITDQGIEVYIDTINYYADEYINTLYDQEEIHKPNSNQFTGMIKYINRHVGFDRKILENINVLNNIWDVYTELVYKYNQKPTIEEYALLIGIHRDTLYSWAKGECRADDYCEKLGLKRSDTVKKWQEECALGRYKSAASGNVGGIFLCKAVDGMAETAPVQVGRQQGIPQQTAQQIADKYKDVLELPEMEKPEL